MRQTQPWTLPLATIAAAVLLGVAVLAGVTQMSASLAHRIPTVVSDRPLQTTPVAIAKPPSEPPASPGPATPRSETAERSGGEAPVARSASRTRNRVSGEASRPKTKDKPEKQDQVRASSSAKGDSDKDDESHEVVRPRLREDHESDAKKDVESESAAQARPVVDTDTVAGSD